eukprot:CAMPEP_0172423298 /NCGR_PEP_ID=MMETSP1064-20121228/15050_1 /TAXON_ID=202472 /ORGANISM="Aulacoseira subarctica , Strain CCAP 1002/5" /LENGTH=386 /DNA_ID=CAMNT_0013164589 /DNA_START=107 /DNA_END=1267 /DNA_ORIENTATION=-
MAQQNQQQQQQDFSSSFTTLPSLHLDYIHDISFDHYGRRLATCSGDRTIRVWDLDCSTGQWVSDNKGMEWQAHKGTVNKLSWAHPEFGQLLASAGSDHAVIIWEEREQQQQDSGASSAQQQATTHWASKAQLNDARKSVTCVSFAPRHLGLKIAAGSADGVVRIYEAIDVMNLNHWPLNGTIDAETTDQSAEESAVQQLLGVTCLAWGTGRLLEPPTLAIGTSNGSVGVYRYSDTARQWQILLKLPGQGGVLDVAWAPNVGRSFHWIATAGKDRVLRVHTLKRCNRGGTKSNSNDIAEVPYELESSQVLQSGTSEVWRCAWNVTGTVLASSGDGGIVRMWKTDFHNQWKCVAEVCCNIASGRSSDEQVANTASASTPIVEQLMEVG